MNTQHNPDDLLTPSDAARVLGLSADSVRVLSDNGRLPSMRTVSGRRLFRRSDVDRLAIARAQGMIGAPTNGGGKPRRTLRNSVEPQRPQTPPQKQPTTTGRAKPKRNVRNGTPDGGPLGRLLAALRAARQGDFTVRLSAEPPQQAAPGNGNGNGLGNESHAASPAVMRAIAAEFNAMVGLNEALASEMVRVERVVGREGRMTERVALKEMNGGWAASIGSINALIGDLVQPTTEVARVISAVAEGDFTQKMALQIEGQPVKGEFLRIGTTVNSMVDQLSSFAAEVTRVAKEVGTDGKLGGQAEVPEAAGIWRDLTDNVNLLANNLTAQVRNIAEVTTAVARGDLSKKITVDAKGEVLELKNTVNTMVDQLNSFAAEVTRVAKEVGTEGKLGGQADVKGVSGTWKNLTDNVNSMASNLTAQVRNIAEVTTAVATGDLSKKITVDVKGEMLELKNTINTMVDQLNSFAAEVTRVAREVGTEGKLGGQAEVKGVAGTWKDLTDNVNFMASNLTTQVRGIARVVTAVANGDLSQRLKVEAKGEIAALADTINNMTDTLGIFAEQVTDVARTVGVEGKLGAQADVPGVAGTWKDLTDNVNLLANNLTAQVRNIAEVTTSVAKGDLSKKITVDAKGEVLELKNTINTMVDQLNSFAAEVTRVAKEVGTEGKLGGQADVKGVSGVWKDLTDNVNFMASNLTTQVRGIVKVVTAVANGDLSQKLVGVEAKGEIAALADTLNSMTKTLGIFAEQVTSVARTVGVEGKLGAQAEVPGVAGTWKDLTDNVNLLANNLTAQVRNIAEVTTAVATGDLSKKITVDVKGEILELKNTINTMVDQLRAFASEVTRVAREVGTEGKLGGQADVRGVSGTWKDLTDNVNVDGVEPDRPGAQHRQGDDRGRQRRPVAEDHGQRPGRDPRAQEHHQHDGRSAARLRQRGHARRARGRHRGQAGRPGAGAGRQRHVEGPDRQRQPAGRQPHRSGAQHRQGHDGGRQRRPVAEDHRRRQRRDPRAQEHHQHDGRSAAVVRGRGHARREGGRHRGQAGRPGRGQGRQRRVEGPDRQRQLHGVEPDRAGAQHRAGHDGGRQRRPVEEDHRRRQGRDPRAEEHHQHDGRSAQQLRQRGHARREGGRHRGQAGRPGGGAGGRRRVEEPHRQRQLHGPQPDHAGARHRQGRHRGRQRRPEAEDGRRGEGRDRRARRHHQQHDRHAVDVRRAGVDGRARGRRRGEAGRPGARARACRARGRT